MKISGIFLSAALLASDIATYQTALPGYRYQFPRDHFSHPAFQTEWWYYTGNLRASDGHRFGFELTFFRHAVQPPATASTSVWDVQDVWLAHLALSDVDGNRFYHTERLNRTGAGLAGADQTQERVWNGNWEARGSADRQLRAVADGFGLALSVHPSKPLVIHGISGVSQKAEGPGRASHYISYTRLAASGTVNVAGKQYSVEGSAWMDHEFFTHQLSAGQTGWDWFSLQFDNGNELMLFRLRRKDGSVDPYSAGTFVDRQGRSRHLSRDEFTITPGKTWISPESHARYPVEWSVVVPGLGIDARITTRLPQQELSNYWEGAIQVTGKDTGVGYLEMTGYAGPVQMGE